MIITETSRGRGRLAHGSVVVAAAVEVVGVLRCLMQASRAAGDSAAEVTDNDEPAAPAQVTTRVCEFDITRCTKCISRCMPPHMHTLNR